MRKDCPFKDLESTNPSSAPKIQRQNQLAKMGLCGTMSVDLCDNLDGISLFKSVFRMCMSEDVEE